MKTGYSLVLSIITALVLPACGESAAPIERNSDSFLADYNASLARANEASGYEIDGRWAGVAFCPSGAYPVDIRLENARAKVSVLPSIISERKTTPFHEVHVDRTGTVEYVPGAQRLTLTMSPDDPGAVGSQKPHTRGLGVELLLSPEDSGRALMSLYESNGRHMRRCDEGIAAHQNAQVDLAAFASNLAAIYKDRRPVVSGECPPQYQQWLANTEVDPQQALVSGQFASAFSKPYLQMPVEALLHASAVLSGSCVSPDDRKSGFKQTRLAASLRDYRHYQGAFSQQYREPIITRWRAWADEQVANDAITDIDTASAMTVAPVRLGLSRHPAMDGFAEQMKAVATAFQTDEQNRQFAQRIEHARDDFRQLLLIAMQAQSRGDVDMRMVSTGLDYYLADAARTYARSVTEVQDAAYLAAWVAQREEGDCPAASEAVCDDAVDHIEERLEDLAETFADSEAARFETLLDEPAGLPRLAAMVAFERDFQRRYAALADHEALRDGVEDRTDDRQDEQDDLDKALVALAKKATATSQMRSLQHDYFIGDDIARQPELVATLDERMQTTRPFAGLSGGAYLDALYNRDFDLLRELDREYLAGITPLMRFGAAQLAELGPLVDAIAGKKRGSTARDLAAGMNNLTALYAVIGTYMVEYQDEYDDCFKPGARTFTITRQTDYVTRDGFGNEIRRRPGWTTSDSYRVNAEFSQHFDALFNTAAGSAQAQLLDLFLNDARIANLRQGVRGVMSRFDCDAAEVTQLERGMLAYDAQIRRRVGG